MAKQSTSLAHFDVAALLAQVAEQDVGLAVSTNDPKGFQRIVYAHMAAQPASKCHILVPPGSGRQFWLVRPSALPDALTTGTRP